MSRTVAIILTIVSVLCCACPGFGLCIAGVMGLAGVPFTTTLNDSSTTAPISTQMAVGFICLSVILIIIPVAVGFFTLRKKPVPVAKDVTGFDGPIPPAS
ncbi:MAG: hypothetical protein WCP19_12805 [Chloroflexota bacterium]